LALELRKNQISNLKTVDTIDLAKMFAKICLQKFQKFFSYGYTCKKNMFSPPTLKKIWGLLQNPAKFYD
jgi:hypothetical protein